MVSVGVPDALTVSVALRVVLPAPLVLNATVAVYVPALKEFADELTVSVGEPGVVPEVAEAVSHVGRPVIDQPTEPEDAVSE